jgi:hypothetical protein
MERPTKEFTTSGGHKVVLKEWITMNEQREITKAYKTAKVRSINAKDQTAEFADEGMDIIAAIETMQRTSIDLVVVMLDGSADDIADRILDKLPQRDALEIVAMVSKITHPDTDESDTKKH